MISSVTLRPTPIHSSSKRHPMDQLVGCSVHSQHGVSWAGVIRKVPQRMPHWNSGPSRCEMEATARERTPSGHRQDASLNHTHCKIRTSHSG